jgi:hypothetical protein
MKKHRFFTSCIFSQLFSVLCGAHLSLFFSTKIILRPKCGSQALLIYQHDNYTVISVRKFWVASNKKKMFQRICWVWDFKWQSRRHPYIFSKDLDGLKIKRKSPPVFPSKLFQLLCYQYRIFWVRQSYIWIHLDSILDSSSNAMWNSLPKMRSIVRSLIIFMRLRSWAKHSVLL